MDKDNYEKLLNDTFPGLTMFVRDVNLNIVCAQTYQAGMIIRERGFADASRRVMGMITTHRFAILSNHMMDLSLLEHGTGWGLCVAQAGAHFKVLDRWRVFENMTSNIETQVIESSRKRFRLKAFVEPVPELTTQEWLSRCADPLGMDENGNLFEL